jgi:2,3-bisphosphoglycerate-independent phosphoglycerate mutase
MNKNTILIIMDGWGLGKINSSDAIKHAKTPFISGLYNKYPNSTLATCGEDVGLPHGQMGNSEVGHLNLGAGRIVYQELQRINVAIKTQEFHKNTALLEAIQYAKTNNKPLHLFGLVSNGGVHSHINHLKAIIDTCFAHNLPNVFIHAFTDGRDCDPKSGQSFIADLEAYLQNKTGKIATIIGRYYAMDRDKRWDRIALAYNAMVNKIGDSQINIVDAIDNSYKNNITDEFIKPIINANLLPTEGAIKNGDAVLCFNFRTDRCREITEVLTQQNFEEQSMHKLQLHYTTITEYDATYNNVQVMFETDNLNNTLGEVICANNKTQIRIAETEKYPHVTFFFSGGREQPFVGESRLMAPSPKVATYDLQPQMSANELVNLIVPAIEKQTANFICLNFANADMVGHTGIFDAVVAAIETVDSCVEKVATTALANNYSVFITADHGNADFMINEDGSPNTQHSLNLVPLFYLDNNTNATLKSGRLADIAPTILHTMGLKIPNEMTGEILLN